jgi:tetratricopeptide (TPR) repeat protein
MVFGERAGLRWGVRLCGCARAPSCYRHAVRRIVLLLVGPLFVAGLRAAPVPAPTNAAPVVATTAVDPVEQAYEKLLEDDDAALEEVDRWIRDDAARGDKGGEGPDVTLKARVRQRLEPVRSGYEEFLKRHPGHTRARLAFGSFLASIGEEDESVTQMEKAREIDPRNPAAWNNLANHYGHRGPVAKAFEYYAKAIELNPGEPVYYQNLAATVFLFRPDATNFYQCTEQQVFDRSLELYRKAIKLAPSDFLLASDYAMSFYGIKPARTEEALAAWNAALAVAPDTIQREGVQIHLARIQINAGRFEAARQHLDQVANPVYDDLKKRLTRNLAEKQAKLGTNGPVLTSPKP